MLVGRDDVVGAVVEAARSPGLIVVRADPGLGLSSVLTAVAERIAQGRPTDTAVCRAAGIRPLIHRPGLVLARALRIPVPHDLDDAVRLGTVAAAGRPVLLDDADAADHHSVAVAAAMAHHVPVVLGVTTIPPSPVDRPGEPDPGVDGRASLAAAIGGATTVVDLTPLSDRDATTLIRNTDLALDGGSVRALVALARGNPLVLVTLAGTRATSVRRAMAVQLTRCSPAARTAAVALGLLGRPAGAALLGGGAAELVATRLAAAGPDGTVRYGSTVLYGVAATLAAPADLAAIHRRLAELLADPVEIAAHQLTGGLLDRARDTAVTAARGTPHPAVRAALWRLAAEADTPAQAARWWRAAAEDHRRAGDPVAAAEADRHAVRSALSPRELQVLSMLGTGLSNVAIARRLRITTDTVEDHVAAVLRKLGARNRTEAAASAVTTR
ncbi:helix-turn-helix transcriptional regulator [Nakamurella leprariae]|uniref:Helix-turn-helix transcriptional regulator n=1 Tax=Nakamurella leprariae TaxID=2803911 RepID=A0A939BZY2_9ACTN|nr:helix-turn-helix transcriptional regulator [Nakamurella leprariae]MBM9468655.1 helix-turn-helix transcriptional regulator [Nakamurella leprariae]